MQMVLCGRCAATMAENHKVKMLGRAIKDTCRSCGKRRYCAARDVWIQSKMVIGDAPDLR